MARGDEMAHRLMTIPGLGPVTASAMAASIQDVSAFSGAREFAAFLGLTPKQNSFGGKERLGRISKMGNKYLRTLLVVGARRALLSRPAGGRPGRGRLEGSDAGSAGIGEGRLLPSALPKTIRRVLPAVTPQWSTPSPTPCG
jgi:transposase